MTPTEFLSAVKKATHGDEIIYFTAIPPWRGLSWARQQHVDNSAKKPLTEAGEAADALGNATWNAYTDGVGVLVQRRLGLSLEYLFVKS